MNLNELKEKVVQHDEQIKVLPQTVKELRDTVEELKLIMVRLEPLPEQVRVNTADIGQLKTTVDKVRGGTLLMSAVGGIILVGAGAVEFVSWISNLISKLKS